MRLTGGARYRPRMRPRLAAALAPALALAACSGGPAPAGGAAPTYPLPACAPDPAPLATRLLVGFSGSDATAALPGFHLRYQYLAGPLAPSEGCLDPARADAVGCGTAWWGTWQWDQEPPGAFVRSFVAGAEANGLVPMFTYYVLLTASGVPEGAPEVTQAAADAAFLRRYLDDYRFFLVQLGCHRALVHVEPDLWGYAQQLAAARGTGASGLPAPVRAANPSDCGGEPDTIAGLGRCMIAMARRWAPNAKVGLHASAWATGRDCVLNRDPSLDVAAEGAATGAFLADAGAGGSDFVGVDIADRDAGYREVVLGQDTWLDPTDATLPSFAQAFAWSRAVAAAAGRPVLWWQVPVGNTSLPNVEQAWQDDRVQYFFDHPDRVAASGAVGMAFGPGDGAQTTPETDGGYLASRAAALQAAGGQPLAP